METWTLCSLLLSLNLELCLAHSKSIYPVIELHITNWGKVNESFDWLSIDFLNAKDRFILLINSHSSLADASQAWYYRMLT